MKELTIEIKVLVPDDYLHCDDVGWIMDDMFNPSTPVSWESAKVIE